MTQMIIILFPRESGITASVLSTGNEVLTDGKRRGKTDIIRVTTLWQILLLKCFHNTSKSLSEGIMWQYCLTLALNNRDFHPQSWITLLTLLVVSFLGAKYMIKTLIQQIRGDHFTRKHHMIVKGF